VTLKGGTLWLLLAPLAVVNCVPYLVARYLLSLLALKHDAVVTSIC
jgi:hypothetical protein